MNDIDRHFGYFIPPGRPQLLYRLIQSRYSDLRTRPVPAGVNVFRSSQYELAYDIFPNPIDTGTLIPFVQNVMDLNENLKCINRTTVRLTSQQSLKKPKASLECV